MMIANRLPRFASLRARLLGARTMRRIVRLRTRNQYAIITNCEVGIVVDNNKVNVATFPRASSGSRSLEPRIQSAH